MVKIGTINIWVILWLLIAGNAAFATSIPIHLEAKVALSSGVVARVDITTIEFSSTTPKISALRWGADDGPVPDPSPTKRSDGRIVATYGAPSGLPKSGQRIITGMDVYLGNEKLMLPLSAFSDLCDPRVVTIKAIKLGFEIGIKGSDAGGSYEARLVFKGTHLSRRKVASSESPGNVWEETTYHSEFPENW